MPTAGSAIENATRQVERGLVSGGDALNNREAAWHALYRRSYVADNTVENSSR